VNVARLLFARYVLNAKVLDGVLFGQPLPTRTAGESVFVKSIHFNWGRCVGTSTDGARAVTGKRKGAVAPTQIVIRKQNRLAVFLIKVITL
jgi:hypothetical protein